MSAPRFLCPCCQLPTLPSPRGHLTCDLCWWTDDGQDDADADATLGGANKDYSLTRARANVAAHGHMHDADRATPVLRDPGPHRRALMAYADAVLGRLAPLDAAHLAALLDASQRDWRDR